MKRSEEKQKLVQELTELYQQLNVERLYKIPDHKESKDWLSEIAAILKNLDESDFKAFLNHRQHLYPSISEGVRKHAAEQIDGFIRQKVSEYKRYDFSSLDQEATEKSSRNGPIGIINRGKNNIFLNNSFVGLGIGIQDEGENSISTGNKFIGLEKKVKRGTESWSFIYMIWGIFLTIELFIIGVVPTNWENRIIIFLILFFITTWLFLRNPWFQNKLIGLKIRIEDTWGKL